MPPAQLQRRQNTSCDPCRRSKRRCFFSPPAGDGEAAGAACANCKRIGHHCTFDYARSRSGVHRRRQNPRIFRQSIEWEEPSAPERAADGFTSVLSGEFDDLVPLLDLDFGTYVQDDALFFTGNTYLSNPLAPAHLDEAAATTEARSEARNYASTRSDMVQRALPYNAQYIIGNSLNSPIRLLNSKLNSTILDERLARIHDTIVTGCASRFVDYDCNLHATECRYRLEDWNTENSQERIPVHSSSQTNVSPLTPNHSISQPETEGDRMTPQMLTLKAAGYMMTVLGTVRFLDHFSDLYGNRLTLTTRRQSDAALKAVLRAFSLQWLSPYNGEQAACDSLISTFHDVWFKARSLINNALPVRSFRVVYAILLFDGIAIPTEAASRSAGPVEGHEFLDMGLQKLSYLDGLVKEYCAHLGSRSTYSALLDASLSVVRWGGYIRDIGAALTSDHRCKLPGISSNVKGKLNRVLRGLKSNRENSIPNSTFKL